MAKNTLKNLKKKLKRQAKRAATQVRQHAIKQSVQAMKKHNVGRKALNVGKRLGREAKLMAEQQLVSAAIAAGSGAYGRGAYGRGSYSTGAPANVNSLFNEYPHRRHKTTEIGDETGRTRVSRREYVMRVVAPEETIEFENTSFSINPGMRGVFAWLSQIAANYDEYELEHLVFHYKPVISQASTSGAMGSILLSCNYNAGAPKFKSFREMAEYMGTLETRVCDEAYFGVECDPTKHGSQAIEFIRTGEVPPGQDIKTYDMGLFQIATSDVSTFTEGTLLGHLYVEYSVVLGKPKLYTAMGLGIMQDMMRGQENCSQDAPFSAAPIYHPSNTIGVQLSPTTNRGVFPSNFYGRVMITWFTQWNGVNGVGFNNAQDAITGFGNVTLVPIQGRTGQENDDTGGSTAQERTIMSQAIFDITAATGGAANGFEINFIVDGGGTTGGFNLDICQCNPNFSPLSWV